MKVERDLYELPELFEQIFSTSPWPMLMLDADGVVLGASDEPGACDAGPRADVTLRGRAAHYVSALRADGVWPGTGEIDLVRTLPSGARVHERLHARRTRWGVCVVVVDETELRRLQTVDIQSARLAALGFMVAGVCHEVTNPLTSLHSIVQILRSEKELSQELLNKGLDNISVNVKRILDISRRLVKFSRIDDEPRSQFPIDDAIAEALSVMRQDGLLQGIDVVYRPDPAATVFGHTGQVREIFLNLFVNAVQAMSGRGRLSISTRLAGSLLEVIVGDTGPGIRGDAVSRIFEPFFTTKSSTHGTGLGLAISTEIAQEHGGTIRLHDTSAQGASFSVLLPRERP